MHFFPSTRWTKRQPKPVLQHSYKSSSRMISSSKQNFLEGEELMTLVRERVAQGQSVRYLPFRGVSMLPMLRQGKDAVEVSPLPEKLKKYDLPVYQYPSGKYVMHRVVDVKDGYYVCNGDNLLQMEKVYPEQMIAVVTAFTRNGKRIEVDDQGYLIYCKVWCAIRPARHLWKRVRAFLGKVKRRLF